MMYHVNALEALLHLDKVDLLCCCWDLSVDVCHS